MCKPSYLARYNSPLIANVVARDTKLHRSSSVLPPLRNSLHHAFALLAVSGNGRTIRPWTSGFGIHAQTTAREDLPEEALVGSLISVLVSLDPGISSVSDYMYDSRSACNHRL